MFTPPYSRLAREHAVSVPQGGPVYREGQRSQSDAPRERVRASES